MSDLDELRALVEAYATAADGGDTDTFAGLFLPDATLTTWPADGSVGSHYGSVDAIAAIPGRLRAYDSTDHLVGEQRVSVALDGASASGLTRCQAHHVRDRVDRVLTITYEDTFGRDDAGRWRFASRDVRVESVEERAVPR